MASVVRLTVCALWLSACARLDSPPAAPPPDTGATVAFLSAWLADESPDAAVATALVPWRALADAMAQNDPATREDALSDVHQRHHSPYLRAAALRAMARDPAFQSRRAQFVRRYGFYAGWFNRLVHTSLQTLQGNVAAVGGLAIAAVDQIWPRAEADPEQRRLHHLNQEVLRQRGGTLADADEQARLARAVNRAHARDDLDRARWALKDGAPTTARFYAQQAADLAPGWWRAQRSVLQAEKAVARVRRRDVAAAQAGYPDRTPPLDLTPPTLLSAVLADAWTTAAARASHEERPLIEALAALPSPGSGRLGLMRQYEDLITRSGRRSFTGRAWLEATTHSPRFSPDRRLAQARAWRRGRSARYIFLGAASPRRHLRETASALLQTYDSLLNLGAFWVFQVLGRSVEVLVAPPVPADVVRDAAAHWLAEAETGATRKETEEMADWLANAYLNRGRDDDARRVLRAHGLLDADAQQKLDRRATQPPEAKRTPPAAHAQTIQATWGQLSEWTGRPAPCGLPARAEWFDGETDNGEVDLEVLTFLYKGTDRPLEMRCRVRRSGRAVERTTTVAPEAVPPSVVRWLRVAASRQRDTDETLRQLGRPEIPIALEGALGLGGADVSPRLLPIQPSEGELRLYR